MWGSTSIYVLYQRTNRYPHGPNISYGIRCRVRCALEAGCSADQLSQQGFETAARARHVGISPSGTTSVRRLSSRSVPRIGMCSCNNRSSWVSAGAVPGSCYTSPLRCLHYHFFLVPVYCAKVVNLCRTFRVHYHFQALTHLRAWDLPLYGPRVGLGDLLVGEHRLGISFWPVR